MRESFIRYIRAHGLTRPGEVVLVALSGGADSMALLSLFAETAADLGIGLAVAHVDHGLRPESPAEAEFARAAARRLGLPFLLRRVDVAARLGVMGGGVESAARELRYAALWDCAKESGASRVATAHHRDDQLETLLMRLLRGSAAGGLRGIAPLRADGVIRPLLFATRAEILGYIQSRGIAFVTDSSNLDPTYTRNRLRLEILPRLLEIFPGGVHAAARCAEILGEEDAYMDGVARDWLASRLAGNGRLSLEGFTDLGAAIQRRVLRRYAAGLVERAFHGGDLEPGSRALQDEPHSPIAQNARSAQSAQDETHESGADGPRAPNAPAPLPPAAFLNLTFDHIEALRRLAMGRTGARLSLPGLVLEKEAAALRRAASAPLLAEAPLRVPGQTRLPGVTLTLHPAAPPYALGQSPWEQFIDGDKLPPGAVLRGRRPGDRLHALGAAGAKKLSAHMIDRKIPRDVRDSLPVIAVGGTVLWAAGVALSEALRLTPDSARVLRCELTWDILDPLS